MLCPNKVCLYKGFSPTGICPKCGEKMVPNEMQHLLLKEKTSASKKIRHYMLQVLFRLIESLLFCGLAFLILKFFILTYNGLCREMLEWTPIDEAASYMYGFKIILFTFITLLTFRYRFRTLWSES